ncbi:MAG: hypothetical protein M0031_16005 [Thermaerobacter sp.]|jgi:hypothetical protein|nr:hypothetical protein [Thermaerobacter sp.]
MPSTGSRVLAFLSTEDHQETEYNLGKGRFRSRYMAEAMYYRLGAKAYTVLITFVT